MLLGHRMQKSPLVVKTPPMVAKRARRRCRSHSDRAALTRLISGYARSAVPAPKPLAQFPPCARMPRH